MVLPARCLLVGNRFDSLQCARVATRSVAPVSCFEWSNIGRAFLLVRVSLEPRLCAPGELREERIRGKYLLLFLRLMLISPSESNRAGAAALC